MMNLRAKSLAAVATLFGLAASAGLAQQPAPVTPQTAARTGPVGDFNVSKRTPQDKALPNPYLMNQAWYAMPQGRLLGGASGIDMDRDGKSIWIVERCGGRDLCADSHVDPVMHFSADGKVLATFGRDMIFYPHGLYVDRDNNIWVTDLQSNVDTAARNGRPFPAGFRASQPNGVQVLKFSPQGKLLLRLGTPGVYGSDSTHFTQPSDVVTNDKGEIFVTDSHDTMPSSNRIMKFDRTGKFLKQWTNCQPDDSKQFDCGHALAIDRRGRLFVGNRGNNVIDIYDQDGKLLDRWRQFGKPSGMYIDKKDILYVSDSQSGIQESNAFVKGVHVGSADTGVVTAFIPDPLGNMSPWSGASTLSPEGVTVDDNGIIFTSSVTPAGLTRYTPNNNTRWMPVAR